MRNRGQAKATLAVLDARLNDHLDECAARYLETRQAILDLNKLITRGGIAVLSALVYVIYNILHAKGTL